MIGRAIFSAALAFFAAACSETPPAENYDLIIRGGAIYDGDGGPGYVADLAIEEDRIAAIGDLSEATADEILMADGMAVAPGFINVLSWATESLIEDGRGLSDIQQGVTLEVFGEGWSMGPLTDPMKKTMVARQSDVKFDVEWTSLGDYLDYLEAKCVLPKGLRDAPWAARPTRK